MNKEVLFGQTLEKIKSLEANIFVPSAYGRVKIKDLDMVGRNFDFLYFFFHSSLLNRVYIIRTKIFDDGFRFIFR